MTEPNTPNSSTPGADIDFRNWTEDQWREKLSPEEFYVLRQAGTEPPGVGEYTNTTTEGVYRCRACLLYTSPSPRDS